jgi:hypothetical protein
LGCNQIKDAGAEDFDLPIEKMVLSKFISYSQVEK